MRIRSAIALAQASLLHSAYSIYDADPRFGVDPRFDVESLVAANQARRLFAPLVPLVPLLPQSSALSPLR